MNGFLLTGQAVKRKARLEKKRKMAAVTDDVTVPEGALLASAAMRVVDVPHAVSLYRFVDAKVRTMIRHLVVTFEL